MSPLFERRRVRDNFARAAQGYADVAVLQREVEDRLLEQLDHVRVPPTRVLDVGAGTGAVTLELARKASDGTVYAVERKPEAVALLHENRIKLGGYNVKIIEGPAPEALENLPAPDCVFVGRSGGRIICCVNKAGFDRRFNKRAHFSSALFLRKGRLKIFQTAFG